MSAKKLFFPKQILIMLLLAVVLNLARVAIFNSTYFVYLLWNIFLATLPFVVSSVLLWYSLRNQSNKILLIVCGILWLLLLPNAPYIVTDMIHLGRNHAAPFMYDVFLIFSSAWVGLLLCMYSISHIEKIIRLKYGPKTTSLMIALVVLLTSFGIYLGRFLRFNSWDVFSSHSLFFNNIWNIFLQPSDYGDAYAFTGVTFLFIYMSYLAWKYAEKGPNTNISKT